MNLFTIRNLECSYNSNKALEIKHLDIPCSKMVVLIGKSGVGKSTILETLGLMNNTISNESQLSFSPESEDNIYNYTNLWKTDKHIYHIRKKHFSFIFQNTNLMPNFTAYENVCLTQIIQGKTKKEAMSQAIKIMKSLNLDDIDKNKKAYELSGGQRQRLAFARAITPDFTVLFGDEPTGNLDEYNSEELMNMLKRSIIEKNRSAIIVSHNIELSVKYADEIIILTKCNGYGELKEDNIFDAQEDNKGNKIWKNKQGHVINNVLESIKERI